MVDVEADGPIPGDYSMISIGVVRIDSGMEDTFHGELKPISEKYLPEALEVGGYVREQTLAFEDPKVVMERLESWIAQTNTQSKPMFISDNNGFDWMFVCWYFHHFLKRNPFGFSSSNLGSLYKGMMKNTRVDFKHLRKTEHTHHPVDDAKGNAEAFLYMIEMGLKI